MFNTSSTKESTIIPESIAMLAMLAPCPPEPIITKWSFFIGFIHFFWYLKELIIKMNINS